MLTKADLKSKRGWTEKLIRDFLGAPDKKKPHRFGSSIHLFDIGRVENVEKSPKFKRAVEYANKNRERAKKGVETKLKNIRNTVDQITIEIPRLGKDDLISYACENYNKFREDDYLSEEASDKSDAKFLSRICVNYIRHNLTGYDAYLNMLGGKVGFCEAYKEVRRKVFDEIIAVYPWLAEECERQRKRKEELDAFRDSNKR